MIGMFWPISWYILILVYWKVYLCILVSFWSCIDFFFLRKETLINKCVNLKKNQIKKLIEIHNLIFFKEYQIKKLIEIHNLR